MVTTLKVNNDLNTVLPGEGYDGVVRISIGGFYGTGTLLYDGQAILTSAHLIEGNDLSTGSVFFDTAAGRESYQISDALIHPEYDPVDANSDLALLWLTDSVLADVDRYALYHQQLELGQIVTISPPVSGTRIKLLFASRMLWDKGIGDVIEAGKILRQKGLDFELNVAGIIDYQSPNAVPEAQIAQWHDANHINWLGCVENMEELIRESDIVLLPTCYGEGVPRILIEAASIGRCIITTDVTGCRDIVKDGTTGFLVPVKDPAALADKIEILMGDERLRRNMGFEARKLVEEKWDQRIVIKRTLSTCHALLL